MQIGQLKDSICFPDETSSLRQKRTAVIVGFFVLAILLWINRERELIVQAGLGFVVLGTTGVWTQVLQPQREKRDKVQAEAALVHLHSLVNNPEYRAFDVAVLEASWLQRGLHRAWGKAPRSAVDQRGDRWTVYFALKTNEKFPAKFYELHNNPLSGNQRYAVVPRGE